MIPTDFDVPLPQQTTTCDNCGAKTQAPIDDLPEVCPECHRPLEDDEH